MGRRIKPADAASARNVPLFGPADAAPKKAPSAPGFVLPQKIVIPHDPVSEGVCIAAAATDRAQRATLVRKLFMDHFLVREHSEAWGAVVELERRHLEYDPQTVAQILSAEAAQTIERLVSQIPNPTANIDFHVGNVMWDRAKMNAINGPFQKLLESLRDPIATPTQVRALTRSLESSFDGFGDRGFVHDPITLVREQMKDVEARCEGRAVWPYGIDGLDFYNDQFRDGERKKRMIPGAAPGQITCVTAISGGGKALAVDTPIATPVGWATMGTLVVGDRVFDEHGEVCRVLAVTSTMLDRECFEVEFSDGAKVVADAEHLWKTISFRDRYLTARAAKRAVYSPTGSVRTTRQIAETLRSGKHANHMVPVAAPLVLSDADLPIDPYVLGAWLGDGTTADGRFTTADSEIIDHICDAGYHVKRTTSKYGWQILGLKVQLREVGVLGTKHIPSAYLRASIPQRLALLQGLLDTDGSYTLDGKCNFDSTCVPLVRGVEELLASLGIKCKPRERDAKLNGRVVGKSWRFVFCTDLPVFRLKRKLERMRPTSRGTHARRYIVAARSIASVPVKCIAVDSPSRMFLAGREMIPTHNSTFTAHIALGLARLGRRVLWGAWEMRGGMNLELMACISLGWSRQDLTEGYGIIRSYEGKVELQERMHAISQCVRFLKNPFKHDDKDSNARNLDLLHGILSDEACDVFIADLWKRCLADDDPNKEEKALLRQQSMAEELNQHHILLQQQRLKDIESRADPRPTREGIKGSGAWIEVPDTIIGLHRPALWKSIDDNKIEGLILKQRYGLWPCAVEFGWSAEHGSIEGGRSIVHKRMGEGSDIDNFTAAGAFLGQSPRKGKGGRR